MRRLLPLLGLLFACGGNDGPDPCAQAPTYTNDIAALVTEHCIMCHDQALVGPARNGAPMERNFNDYDTLEPQLADFADVITSGRMPPMDRTDVVPVRPDERAVVSDWRRCGYPR